MLWGCRPPPTPPTPLPPCGCGVCPPSPPVEWWWNSSLIWIVAPNLGWMITWTNAADELAR